MAPDGDTDFRATYEFGDFRLNTRRALLESILDGRALDLASKEIATLQYLVEHAGELVEKRELMAAVWPTVIVEEGNLTQTIYLLRRHLGEHPRDHRYIVTVPGRGYRFVAQVRKCRAAGDAPATPPAAIEKRWPTIRTLLIVALAGSLLALFLGVRAKRVDEAAALRRTEAEQHFVQAQFFYGRRGQGDSARARAAYESTLAMEPNHARAWAGLAAVAQLETDQGNLPPARGLLEARAAAARALEADPNLAEAHLRLANLYWRSGDSIKAAESFERGVALDPESALVLAMRAGQAAENGDLARAIELQRRAVAREPLSMVQHGNLGSYLFAAGRYSQAASAFGRAHEISGSPDTAADLAQVMLVQRRFAEALQMIVQAAPSARRDHIIAIANFELARTTEADGALARLASSAADEDPFLLAETFAVRGETERAIEWLERALTPDPQTQLLPANRHGWEMRASPLLASLHAHPRWHELKAPNGGGSD